MTRARTAGPSARDIARRVLERVEEGAYSGLALAGELERSGLGPEDRALATEIAYGTLRHRQRLDRALAACAPRGLGRLDGRVLDALRAAAFQILLLDRVPAHAAVNEAVEAVKRLRGQRVGGFANALLRRLAREGEPALPDPEADPLGALVFGGSLPQWFAQRVLESLGPREALAFAAAQNRPPPVWLRVNVARGTRDEALASIEADAPSAEARGSALVPEALSLRGAASPGDLEAVRRGLATVQDLGAQLIGRLCGAGAGETILDACAGVGGKSTHLAETARGKAVIHAADRSSRKLGLLQQHASRLGLRGIVPIEVDLTAPGDRLAPAYDRVLLDAPCTALGVARRHPELKWRRTPDDVGTCAAVQERLLHALAPRVRVGGVLVYAVCSPMAEEGERQVARFLERNPGFRLDPPDDPVVAAFLDERGLLRTWPHRHDADAFVAARMRRIA